MFSQLLQQCQQIFKIADQSIKQNKKLLKQSRINIPHQLNIIDPTKTAANCVSFPKAQRFKQLQKQQLKLNDLSFCESLNSSMNDFNNQTNPFTLKKNNFTFTKSQRFMDKAKSQKQISETILYPNYQVVKKNNKNGAIIKKPIGKDLSKSNVSQMTAATLTQVGPGKYFIQNFQDKVKKSAAFSKQKRFKKQNKPYEDTPLFINQNQTRKRPPTAALMKPKLNINEKLITMKQQQQTRQRLKLIYWKSIPLQIDRLFKTKIGPILKQKYFDIKKMVGKQKRCAILMMLDRLNYIRGGFQNNIAGDLKDQSKCQVVYRKSTPKPFKFSEMEPGPDYYYPQDDLIKTNHQGFTFGKSGQQPKKPVFDDRDYEINEQIFKKGGNIIINPIHKENILTQDQIRKLNIGPGFYDCLFGQTEKRTDIGVLKFTEINQKNARENNCIQINKDVNDAMYFPNYNAIDPNIQGPIIKQNANVTPIHLPQKVLFPQHWVFYDGDLNKVRAQIAKNVILAKNMNYDQYKKYKVKFQAFKSYLKSRQPQPQVGQYNVDYKQIDGHVQGFQMAKMQQKAINCQGIKKQEGQVDGDNLILNPKDYQNHLPNFNFGKLVGRTHLQQDNSQFNQPKQGDRLILQPKKLDKKLPNIKFQNYVGRQDNLQDISDPDHVIQGAVLILNPKPIQKHIPQINMQKQSLKKQPQILDIHDDVQQLIINPVQPQRIKGFVQLQRMSVVRLVPLLKQKNIKQGTIRSNLSKEKKQLNSKKSIVKQQQE